jgi:hypothetical protein
MAHLIVPQPNSTVLPAFFNVDGVVGASPAANKREDVLLVQFAFTVVAKSPGKLPPELVAAAKAVRVTGSVDPATITAIRATQETLKKTQSATVVDGRVSPARGAYSYGGGLWTVGQLSKFIQARHADLWPRIDKILGCPDELKSMVTRTVTGIVSPP